MKIAFFETTDWEIEFLKKSPLAQSNELSFFSDEIAEADLPKIVQCQAVSVFIYSKVTSKVLERIPGLKFIATRST